MWVSSLEKSAKNGDPNEPGNSFYLGIGAGALLAIKDVKSTIVHPIDTINNIIEAFKNYKTAAKEVWKWLSEDFVHPSRNANLQQFSLGEKVGRILFDAVGTKGIGSLTKSGEVLLHYKGK